MKYVVRFEQFLERLFIKTTTEEKEILEVSETILDILQRDPGSIYTTIDIDDDYHFTLNKKNYIFQRIHHDFTTIYKLNEIKIPAEIGKKIFELTKKFDLELYLKKVKKYKDILRN